MLPADIENYNLNLSEHDNHHHHHSRRIDNRSSLIDHVCKFTFNMLHILEVHMKKF